MKYYSIADIIIGIDFPGLAIGKESEIFQVSPSVPDIVYEWKDDVISGEKVYSNIIYDVFIEKNFEKRLYKYISGKLYLLRDMDAPFHEYLCGDYETLKKCQHRIFSSFLSYEVPFIYFDAFFLHSSLVETPYGGIAISGDSGNGKSTQARFWQEMYGAKVLNGDRSLIRFIENECYGYGSPLSGSSHIVCNERVMLKAIIVLEGEEGRLKKVSKKEAFSLLYKQLWHNLFNKEYTERLMDELERLIDCIPVYKIRRRPDREGVEEVKKVLEG